MVVETIRQGDVVLVNLDPTSGSEQSGFRPALVISVDKHNEVQRMINVCPITSTNRKYPTHILIDGHCKSSTGFVMCEQMRAVDRIARNVRVVEHADYNLIEEVQSILQAILWMEYR